MEYLKSILCQRLLNSSASKDGRKDRKPFCGGLFICFHLRLQFVPCGKNQVDRYTEQNEEDQAG